MLRIEIIVSSASVSIGCLYQASSFRYSSMSKKYRMYLKVTINTVDIVNKKPINIRCVVTVEEEYCPMAHWN